MNISSHIRQVTPTIFIIILCIVNKRIMKRIYRFICLFIQYMCVPFNVMRASVWLFYFSTFYTFLMFLRFCASFYAVCGFNANKRNRATVCVCVCVWYYYRWISMSKPLFNIYAFTIYCQRVVEFF